MSANVGARETVLTDATKVAIMLDTVAATLRHTLVSEASRAPLLTSLSAAVDYLTHLIGHQIAEQVHALYLDTCGRLIRTEMTAIGSIRQAPIYPREIMRRALELGASSLILAHNHPSGDPTPSSEDILATKQVAAAAQLFDIELFDHIIVTRSAWTSLRAEGLL